MQLTKCSGSSGLPRTRDLKLTKPSTIAQLRLMNEIMRQGGAHLENRKCKSTKIPRAQFRDGVSI